VAVVFFSLLSALPLLLLAAYSALLLHPDPATLEYALFLTLQTLFLFLGYALHVALSRKFAPPPKPPLPPTPVEAPVAVAVEPEVPPPVASPPAKPKRAWPKVVGKKQPPPDDIEIVRSPAPTVAPPPVKKEEVVLPAAPAPAPVARQRKRDKLLKSVFGISKK
jgi:outer membrane biosynthesis protein TonB